MCVEIILRIDKTYTLIKDFNLTNKNKTFAAVGLTDSTISQTTMAIKRCPVEKQTDTKYKMVFLAESPEIAYDPFNPDDRIIIFHCAENQLPITVRSPEECIFERSIIVKKFSNYFPILGNLHKRL